MYKSFLYGIKKDHVHAVIKPIFVVVTIAAYFRAIGSILGFNFVY